MELAELFADVAADITAEILVEVLADVAGGERVGVIGVLLTGLDVAEPLGLWRSIKNVGIAYWQNFKSLAELKLS